MEMNKKQLIKSYARIYELLKNAPNYGPDLESAANTYIDTLADDSKKAKARDCLAAIKAGTPLDASYESELGADVVARLQSYKAHFDAHKKLSELMDVVEDKTLTKSKKTDRNTGTVTITETFRFSKFLEDNVFGKSLTVDTLPEEVWGKAEKFFNEALLSDVRLATEEVLTATAISADIDNGGLLGSAQVVLNNVRTSYNVYSAEEMKKITIDYLTSLDAIKAYEEVKLAAGAAFVEDPSFKKVMDTISEFTVKVGKTLTREKAEEYRDSGYKADGELFNQVRANFNGMGTVSVDWQKKFIAIGVTSRQFDTLLARIVDNARAQYGKITSEKDKEEIEALQAKIGELELKIRDLESGNEKHLTENYKDLIAIVDAIPADYADKIKAMGEAYVDGIDAATLADDKKVKAKECLNAYLTGGVDADVSAFTADVPEEIRNNLKNYAEQLAVLKQLQDFRAGIEDTKTERDIASARLAVEKALKGFTFTDAARDIDEVFKKSLEELEKIHANTQVYSHAQITEFTTAFLVAGEGIAKYETEKAKPGVVVDAKVEETINAVRSFKKQLEDAGLTPEAITAYRAAGSVDSGAEYDALKKIFNDAGTIENFVTKFSSIWAEAGKEDQTTHFAANLTNMANIAALSAANAMVAQLTGERDTALGEKADVLRNQELDMVLLGKIANVSGTTTTRLSTYTEEQWKAAQAYGKLVTDIGGTPLTDEELADLKTELGKIKSEKIKNTMLEIVDKYQHDLILYSKLVGDSKIETGDERLLAPGKTIDDLKKAKKSFSIVREYVPFRSKKKRNTQIAEVEQFITENFKSGKATQVVEEAHGHKPFLNTKVGKVVKIGVPLVLVLGTLGGVGLTVLEQTGVTDFVKPLNGDDTPDNAAAQDAFKDALNSYLAPTSDGGATLTEAEFADLEAKFGSDATYATIIAALKNQEAHTSDQIKTPDELTQLGLMSKITSLLADDGVLSAEDIELIRQNYYTDSNDLTGEQKAMNEIIDALGSDGEVVVTPENPYAEFVSVIQNGLADDGIMDYDEIQEAQGIIDELLEADADSEIAKTMQEMLDGVVGDSYSNFVSTYGQLSSDADGLTTADLEVLKTMVDSEPDPEIKAVLDSLYQDVVSEETLSIYDNFAQAYADALASDGVLDETELEGLKDTYGADAVLGKIIDGLTPKETTPVTPEPSEFDNFMNAFNEALEGGLTSTELTTLETTYGSVEGVSDIIESFRNQAPSTPGTPTPSAFDEFMEAFNEAVADGMTETDLTNLEKTYGSVEGVSEIIEAYRNQETHTGDQLITDGQKDIVEFMEAFNEAVADGMTETDLTNLEKTYGDVEGVAEIIEAYRNQAPSTPVTPTPTQTEFDKFMTEYVSLLNDADGLTTVDLDTLESKYGAVEGVSAFLAAYRNQESHTNDQIITEDQKDKLENYDELEAKNQYLAAEEQELDAFTQLYNTKGVTVEQLQAARDSYAATDNAAYGSNSTDTMDSMIAQKVELNSQVQQAKAEIEALKASGAANSEFLDELYYALTLAESGEMTDAEIREFLSSLYGIDLPSNTNPSAPDAPIRGE